MKTIESVQKIIKVGDSYAVTIPKKEADALGFKPGLQVRSRHEELAPAEKPKIDAEYEKFTKKYQKALKNLAER